MKLQTHLIIDCYGNMRLTKKVPALNMREVSVNISIEIPDAVFNKPTLCASIIIDDSEIDRNLSAEVQSNVIDAIKESTGLKVELVVNNNESAPSI